MVAERLMVQVIHALIELKADINHETKEAYVALNQAASADKATAAHINPSKHTHRCSCNHRTYQSL